MEGDDNSRVHACLQVAIALSIKNGCHLELWSSKRPVVVKFCSSGKSESDLQVQEVGAEKQKVKVGIKAGTFLGRRERTQSKQTSILFHSLHIFVSGCLNQISHWYFLKQSFQGFCCFKQSLYQLHCLQGSCNQGEKQLKLITMGEVPRVKVPLPTLQHSRPLTEACLCKVEN